MAALMQRFGGMQPQQPQLPGNMGRMGRMGWMQGGGGGHAMGGPAPDNMGRNWPMGGGEPPLPDPGLMAGNALPSSMGGGMTPPMTGGTSPPPVIPPALSPSPLASGQPAGMGDQMSGLLRLLIPGLMGR